MIVRRRERDTVICKELLCFVIEVIEMVRRLASAPGDKRSQQRR